MKLESDLNEVNLQFYHLAFKGPVEVYFVLHFSLSTPGMVSMRSSDLESVNWGIISPNAFRAVLRQ